MNNMNMADIPQSYTYRVRFRMASKVKKDASQLSINKYIKRARDYVIKLIENDLKLYRAKARDISIVSTLKKYLIASA